MLVIVVWITKAAMEAEEVVNAEVEDTWVTAEVVPATTVAVLDIWLVIAQALITVAEAVVVVAVVTVHATTVAKKAICQGTAHKKEVVVAEVAVVEVNTNLY